VGQEKFMEEITSTQKYEHPPSEENPSDLERWGSLIGGGALVLMGLQQRSLKGVLMAIAGGGLMYQATQNKSTLHQAQEALGLNKSQHIRVEKTVTINRSAEELYQFWRNFYNLPKFMKHIKSIIVYDDHRSHWVATAPLGTTIEWDAEIIQDETNHLIS